MYLASKFVFEFNFLILNPPPLHRLEKIPRSSRYGILKYQKMSQNTDKDLLQKDCGSNLQFF